MYRKTALFFLLFSFVIALCACSEKVNNISPTPPPSDTAQSGTVSTPEPTPEPVYTDIVINEVMPSNGAVLLNSYGEFSDWIEIYNAGERDASLSGYYLSDDPENLLKWQMPAYELKAGEYALIFASGRDSTASEIHAPFKLSKEGEDLFITSADCTIISTLSFKNAEKNISVGWDGKAYRYPTPGYSNDDAASCTVSTDEKGIAKLRIDHWGVWVVKTKLELPASDAMKEKVNQENYFASLTFSVP